MHTILLLLTATTVCSQPMESVKDAGERSFLAPAGPIVEASCPTPIPMGTDTVRALAALRERLKGPVAAAHQGGLFGATPNTIRAFEDARLAGIDVVEMDLHASADGVAVVYHDDDLSRWTECRGHVREKTVAELKQCRFRNSESAMIPTFEEVLDWSQGRVVVDAEFKDFESIAPALDLVRRREAYPWVYFQVQGNRQKYVRVRALDAGVALLFAAPTREALDWVLSLKDDFLLIVEIDDPTRSRENIAAIHAAGKLVTEDAWHLSSRITPFELFASACGAAFEMDIDIAVSNRPSSCVGQRNARIKNPL